MISQIQKFWRLTLLGNLRLALVQTFDFLRRALYSKLGLSDFIRSKLLIGGPAAPLHAIHVLVHRNIIGRPAGDEISIMEEDWDNLILLDSYREDYFRNHSQFEGELTTAISKGTWSLEFIVNNFQGSQFHDTVVVTSNPYYQRYSKLDEGTFHDIIYCPKTEGINSFIEVLDRALEANEMFPNKRLLVHVMKPHTPHIGETSNRYRKKFNDIYPGMFPLYKSGVISKRTLEQSYCDTIAKIEPRLEEFINKIDGKSVISSDHGENLGEKYYGLRQFGHGNPTSECYKIPWLELSYKKRREITEDQPVSKDRIPEEEVADHLEALGYK